MRDKIKKNLGLKLIAFLFSFLLWLIVVNIDNPVVSKTFSDIPVVVEHAELLTEKQKTYQIVDDTQNVNVTVSAKRRVISRIKAEDIIVTADFKELYLDSQIPLSVKVEGYENTYESAVTSPRNLQVQIEDNNSKTINITPVAVGDVRDGYVLGNLTTEPETVTINGPESLINRINKVVAEVDVSGLAKNATLDATIKVYDSEGEMIDPTRLGNNLGDYGVQVKVLLYKVKSVPVKIDTSGIILSEGYSISSVKLSPEEIAITGPNDVLNSVSEIEIPASELEGKEVKSKSDFSVDIKQYLPENIQLVDTMADSVVASVAVQREGMKNYELPVGSITVKNLYDSLRLSYVSMDDLDVRVIGTRGQLADFNIVKAASIDLINCYKPGPYTIPVKIEVPEGCKLEELVTVEILLEEK